MAIKLNVRDQLSRRNNASPEDRTSDPSDALPIELPGRIQIPT